MTRKGELDDLVLAITLEARWHLDTPLREFLDGLCADLRTAWFPIRCMGEIDLISLLKKRYELN